MTRIALIGCGQIGIRHLQSLIKSTVPLDIVIIEPNLDSQKFGKNMLSDSSPMSKHNISWFENLSGFNEISDLVIVATNAKNRVKIISNLLHLGNKNFLIEKMICQSKNEYDQLISEMKKFKAKGWVNTNRRYFSVYQKIKNLLDPSDSLKIIVRSGNKGLGSNAIHFLDLFHWYTENKEIQLNGDSLYEKTFPNKRGNLFIEFAGNISGAFQNSKIEIIFSPTEELPLTVEIISNNLHLKINENDESIEKIQNISNIDSFFKYQHVSDLTIEIVSDIIKTNKCKLPTISDLYCAHLELFRIFNSHLRKISKKEPQLCPIT